MHSVVPCIRKLLFSQLLSHMHTYFVPRIPTLVQSNPKWWYSIVGTVLFLEYKKKNEKPGLVPSRVDWTHQIRWFDLFLCAGRDYICYLQVGSSVGWISALSHSFIFRPYGRNKVPFPLPQSRLDSAFSHILRRIVYVVGGWIPTGQSG